ncbi:ABC transporter substrate-binding protein [Amycolatopsis sp. GM8]|uniref:ABC transporter substrate-binding protein n=1 Tax=Amycolatopsis sp. GM8 TaxID=2896530 RepID=UPI001F3CC488|nr:ABC transporter substrate-binding protein [Amycolatopsis sp. GM8]
MTLTAAAACGSSGSASPDEIVIGAIGSYTGRTASTIGPAKDGIQMWADSVNAAGGIKGKKVKLFIEDDAGNATTALAKVKELVEKDHVSAIVSDNSVPSPTWSQYVEQKQIPVIGGFSLTPPFYTSPMFFPTGASTAAQTYVELQVAKSFGPKVASYVCAESPNCAALSAQQDEVAHDVGVDLVINQKVSSTAPSYVPQCQAAKDAGAQSMIIKVPVRPVAEQCRTLGMPIGYVSGGGNVTADVLQSPAGQGLKNVDNRYPLYVDAIAQRTPAGQAFEDAVTKFAPSVKGNVQPFFSAAYIDGMLFKAAVEASNSDNVTSESVLAGLYALPQGFDLGGFTPPLNITKGQPTVTNCAFLTQIENGKWAPSDQLKVCAPQDLVTSLAKQK